MACADTMGCGGSLQEQYCMDIFTLSITNSNKDTVPRKILLTVFSCTDLQCAKRILLCLVKHITFNC